MEGNIDLHSRINQSDEVSVLKEKLDKYSKIRSVEQALELASRDNTIAGVKRRTSQRTIDLIVSILIEDLNKFLNIKNKMDSKQIFETAKIITTEFYMLTIPDISLIFKRAKMGGYGELYESIDGHKIIKWFSEYFDERCDKAEKISSEKHKADILDMAEADDEKVREIIEEIKQKFSMKRIQFEINSAKKDRSVMKLIEIVSHVVMNTPNINEDSLCEIFDIKRETAEILYGFYKNPKLKKQRSDRLIIGHNGEYRIGKENVEQIRTIEKLII